MITIRRTEERQHDRHQKHGTGFPARIRSLLSGRFGDLEGFSEERLPPAAVVPRHGPHDSELITYVREGTLALEDSQGRSSIIEAGGFQRVTAANHIQHHERNPSRTDWAHVFRIWIRPSEAELWPERTDKRFTMAERRGLLCAVASSDGRKGSLRIHQDALVYSCFFDEGHHVVHPLSEHRIAWLHLVQGEVTLEDYVLSSGDGAGYEEEWVVSFTAREVSEILLVDLAESPSEIMKLPGSRHRGVGSSVRNSHAACGDGADAGGYARGGVTDPFRSERLIG